MISEVDGVVSFVETPRATSHRGDPRRGRNRILDCKGKNITVNEDFLRAGEAIMDGSANPHDILQVKAKRLSLATWWMRFKRSRLQGVKINDKHIEVIVRSMLRRVKISGVGDTDFLVDEQVDRYRFEEANEQVIAMGGRPAKAIPLLLGITKASLATDSFLSAASFQETTRVLTELLCKEAWTHSVA